MEVVIGCVGKPSAGKSTFFNAVTDGKAKVGNFPFTTIDPNEGVTYYLAQCPCAAHDKSDQCKPKYGSCENGTRHIPVKLLDVAGLIPGACDGAGLGNKFLDDLRHAHVLMHIIDVSGRTNEKGEETIGYDPINDADWLTHEIHSWVFNNLWRRWSSIARRHNATKASASSTFIAQLSGYGASPSLINNLLNDMEVKDPVDLESWGEKEVRSLVDGFMKHRFPTILVLNKADDNAGNNTDANIEKIVDKYGDDKCFVASAAAECFLRAASKQRVIAYEPGSMFYSTKDDEDAADLKLKPISDMKIKKRLDKISDLVLFRFGSTGVRAAINAAVELSDTVVIYPVRSLKSLVSMDGSGVLAESVMVKKGTTIKELAVKLQTPVYAYVEGEDGRRLAEDEPIVRTNFIVRFVQSAQQALES